MGWVRIDDNLPLHPKIVTLADDAFRLYIVGLCYSNRFLTDGWVPGILTAGRRRAVTKLLDAGLWTVTPDETGYNIHNYLEFQLSRAEVEARREARSKAGRKGAGLRWDDGKPDG